jgi:hypothetical protein
MVNPYAVPAPPRPRRTLRTVLIVVGIVAVVCCGGAVTAGYFLFKGVSAATGPARDATNTFVGDLESGDTTGAYGLLCTDTQRRFTQDQFTEGVGGQPKISSHKIVGVNVLNANGSVSATVTAQLIQESGFSERHQFSLVKEGGAWKVCGDPY